MNTVSMALFQRVAAGEISPGEAADQAMRAREEQRVGFQMLEAVMTWWHRLMHALGLNGCQADTQWMPDYPHVLDVGYACVVCGQRKSAYFVTYTEHGLRRVIKDPRHGVGHEPDLRRR